MNGEISSANTRDDALWVSMLRLRFNYKIAAKRSGLRDIPAAAAAAAVAVG
jgi:hypothetical protein